jgi:UDP-N-acetylmuramoyl-L-alanyl-D-glutamate--2,6-diaminopimelate ligase
MRLTQLIKALDSDYTNFYQPEDFQVTGITCNSRQVRKDSIFVAIKGTNEDGHRFIQEAIEQGARAVIIQIPALPAGRPNPRGLTALDVGSKDVSVIQVKDTRKALAKLAAEFYGNPSSKIKVVGITGTNGKTTVSYLIEEILKEARCNPAVIGTINYRFRDKILPSGNTTPGPIELQSLLADMLDKGVDYAIIEVSSHALDQGRTDTIDFHCAIFTNLAQDHLDYHITLENYFQAKSKLFRNINPDSFVIINNDDEYCRRIKKITPARVVTYGIENQSDLSAKDIKSNMAYTEFLLDTIDGQTEFKTKLIGRHNVYNMLAAISWAKTEGIAKSIIKSAIEKFSFAPGRFEKIDFNGNFTVFLDYAHTEDALKNVINTARELSDKRIIVVFGCGGQRDKTKRPKMGNVVSELADYAIITNDNPRQEDPQEIIEDIKKGIRKNNYCVIPERKEAIRKSLLLAKTGDIVLVAGKGHEDYQILKDKKIHFDDREIISECLKSMSY